MKKQRIPQRIYLSIDEEINSRVPGAMLVGDMIDKHIMNRLTCAKARKRLDRQKRGEAFVMKHS